MKLVRVIALPSGLLLGLFAACSDPPSPPAQAAVGITFSSTMGACAVPGNLFNIPPDPAGSPGVVNNALVCDLSVSGCKPDQYVVVQGDTDTDVECRVSPSADGFDIDVKVETPRLHFQAVGPLSASGGILTAYVYEQSSGQAVNDKGCKVSILTNRGSIKKGAVWATFQCDAFTNPQDPNGSTCSAAGSFIFENCGS